jgi:hypothetical protein
MNKFLVLGAIFLGQALVLFNAMAQETNGCPLPLTKLGSVETNAGTVIIRASADIGTVMSNNGELVVRCKEASETATGRKVNGVAIQLLSNSIKETRLVDYEELAPLLNALDYLQKVDWSVTSMTTFDASYTSKDGFRVSAFSSKRTGVIEFAARTAWPATPPIMLTRGELAQLRGLIEQAKTKLDSIR